MTTWRRSRISRPVDRPERSTLPAGPGKCQHCGADGAIVDFQLTKCPNAGSDTTPRCRYYDAEYANALDVDTIEARRREQEAREMDEWRRRWGGP